MDEHTHITHLIAESFGEPGDRTFRISAKTDSHLIYIWVEKEHLIQLSLLIFQLSEKVSPANPDESIERTDNLDADLSIIEFKVGKIALEFDPDNQLFMIEAIQDEESNDATPINIKSKISPPIILKQELDSSSSGTKMFEIPHADHGLAGAESVVAKKVIGFLKDTIIR